MALILRPSYLTAIEPFIRQPIIKVLTGMRRSGKSSLLRLVADHLAATGLPESHIIYLNFEALGVADFIRAAALHQHIAGLMVEPGPYGILLDEIQEVEGWEKVVNSLFATCPEADIYITGSNSRLLSSELATYVAGRYVTIPVSTLSFSEHMDFTAQLGGGADSVADEFIRYVRRGGFPGLYAATFSVRQIEQAVSDIYNSALIQDVAARHSVRNIDMLRRIAAFALENVGNPFSARSVAAYFKSQRRSVDPETVMNYLDILCEAFILVRVPRYDLQGKKVLSVNEKYYPGDHSLIHANLGYEDRHLPGVLESIVHAELQARGYQTYVGKAGVREIDFVAIRGDETLYVQVTTSLTASDETRAREIAPLLAVRDAFPKLILSLDGHAGGTDHGVRHLWLPQWLLDSPV